MIRKRPGCNGRRRRRNSKNLDGGRPVCGIPDTELAFCITSNYPDPPVCQEDDCVPIPTRHGRCRRRNSKNLDGGLTRSRIVDSELTGAIDSKRPNRPVRQEDGCVYPTCNRRRARDVQDRDGCLTSPTSDIDAEIAGAIGSKRTDRPIREEDDGVKKSTRNCRRVRDVQDRYRSLATPT